MSCSTAISSANTPCLVVADVYRRRGLFRDVQNSVIKARNYRAGAKFYCYSFTNPLSGERTTIQGQRIIQLAQGKVPGGFCNCAEQTYFTILCNIDFFNRLSFAFQTALNQRDKARTSCLAINIPGALFPAVPAGSRRATIRGLDLIKIMNGAVLNKTAAQVLNQAGITG